VDGATKTLTHLIGHCSARGEIPVQESIHDLEIKNSMARWCRGGGGGGGLHYFLCSRVFKVADERPNIIPPLKLILGATMKCSNIIFRCSSLYPYLGEY
jgi:hypothetical protein